MERKPSNLMVGILHRRIGETFHEYEIAVGDRRGLEKKAEEGYSIASTHGLDELSPYARHCLEDKFHEYLRSKGMEDPSCGYIRFIAINGKPGQRIGFAYDYYPKTGLNNNNGAKGLGALFERWCLEHFEKKENVTHMTTSAGLQKHLDANPTLRKAISGIPDALTTNDRRRRQLETRGIDPLAITPIAKWKQMLAKDAPLA